MIKADEYGWSLELPANKWQGCTFEGTTLIKLNCSDNELTELPAGLPQCVSLNILYCSGNELKKLPDLSKCVSLKTLSCFDNQLTELPDLSKCVSLVDLYCYNNQLTEELKVPSGTKVYK